MLTTVEKKFVEALEAMTVYMVKEKMLPPKLAKTIAAALDAVADEEGQ
jgi:hypothetical protein